MTRSATAGTAQVRLVRLLDQNVSLPSQSIDRNRSSTDQASRCALRRERAGIRQFLAPVGRGDGSRSDPVRHDHDRRSVGAVVRTEFARDIIGQTPRTSGCREFFGCSANRETDFGGTRAKPAGHPTTQRTPPRPGAAAELCSPCSGHGCGMTTPCRATRPASARGRQDVPISFWLRHGEEADDHAQAEAEISEDGPGRAAFETASDRRRESATSPTMAA